MSLQLENLSAAYDGYPVFQGFNLKVGPGEAVGIVGPNGSGKTTLLNAIMSLTPKKWGKIVLFGKDVTALPTHELVKKGLTLIPEGRQVFTKMTVRENLEVGAYLLDSGARIRQKLCDVLNLIPFLSTRQPQLAGSLSGGEQQLLVIARGLMSNPRFLLVDEPFLGLSPYSIELVQTALRSIRSAGIGLLVAEEDPDLLHDVVGKIDLFNQKEA
jgi:branched-chain amino acid transport system ATP-binding protein